jgi:hypothetical protein
VTLTAIPAIVAVADIETAKDALVDESVSGHHHHVHYGILTRSPGGLVHSSS